MNAELVGYIEKEILPRYDSFDEAHSREHILSVIEESLKLGKLLSLDEDMLYCQAAYHDVGMVDGRKVHHLASGRILRADLNLGRWFTADQIETMAEAAEDHRASLSVTPRSIYGKVLAEADRRIIPYEVIRRTVQYGLKVYPGFPKEEHWARMLDHLLEKYADGGYLKLWIPESRNAENLDCLRRIIGDRDLLKRYFDEIFDGLTIREHRRRIIRSSVMSDLPRLMEIYRDARELMLSCGDLHQWREGFPTEEMIAGDIEGGVSHVITEQGRIIGAFSLLMGEDPTYREIYEGSWLKPELPYGTIHRLGRSIGSHGISRMCFDWCWNQIQNLRVDTHEDNIQAEECFFANGFEYRGIIHLLDGAPRKAYQRV